MREAADLEVVRDGHAGRRTPDRAGVAVGVRVGAALLLDAVRDAVVVGVAGCRSPVALVEVARAAADPGGASAWFGELRRCVRFSARVVPSRSDVEVDVPSTAAEGEAAVAAGDGAACGQAEGADRRRPATARRIAERVPLGCSLPARASSLASCTGALADSCVRPCGQSFQPTSGERDRAQPEGSGDEAGGDRARESEVSEGSWPRIARRHGVSVVSVRHVWHPLPWGVSASCTRSISPLGRN